MKSTLTALLLLCGISLSAHEPEGPDHWLGKTSLGFSQDWGNTDATDLTFHLNVRRDTTEDSKLHHQYVGDAGLKYKQERGKAANNEGFVKGTYRRFINDSWSWRLWQKFRYDQVKDLTIASNTSAGVGYWVFHEDDHSLQLDAGLGYAMERYERSSDNQTYLSANGLIAYHRALCEWLTLKNLLEGTLSLENLDTFTLDNVTSLLASFDDNWGVESSFHIDYDNSPATGKKKLDLTLQLALTYSF